MNNFDFDIQHIEGSKNIFADYLSREELNSMNICLSNKDEILKAHALTGHSCANITYLFLKQHGSLSAKFKEVGSLIKNCDICLKHNKHTYTKHFPVTR